MKLFGKKIVPVTKLWGVDIRWLFVWLEAIEHWQYRHAHTQRLQIHNSQHEQEVKDG